MRHVTALDWLHVLDTDDLADHAGIERGIHCPEIRAVAEDMADSYDAAVFVSLLRNVGTLLLRLRHRFLKKTVISPFQCLHTWSVMNIVRCRNHHCISEFRNSEHLAPVSETMFFRNAELVAHGIFPAFADIGHAYDLHAFREHLGILGISASTVACSDDDNLYRSVLDICLEPFYREIKFRICRCRRFRTKSDSLAGSFYSLAGSEKCGSGRNEAEALEKFLSIHSYQFMFI